MSELERARHYAALFTHLHRTRQNWRLCVPTDGRPHRDQDQMELGAHSLVRSPGTDLWTVAT